MKNPAGEQSLPSPLHTAQQGQPLGLGQTARMTLGNTLLQYYVQDEYRGRVMSLYMMEFGLTSFGVFGAGVLADKVGVEWAVGGLAILLVIFSILVLIFSPRLRKLD